MLTKWMAILGVDLKPPFSCVHRVLNVGECIPPMLSEEGGGYPEFRRAVNEDSKKGEIFTV